MKQNIFFSSFFVFSLLVSCAETKEVRREETKESNASIKIQEIGLEVMTKDLGQMKWYDATEKVKELGGGWRLPTIEEFEEIYKYKDKIGGFAKANYWSSTEYGGNDAWYQGCFNGSQGGSNKANFYYVRAVRSLK